MRTLHSDRKPNMFKIKIRNPDAQANLFSAHKSVIQISINIYLLESEGIGKSILYVALFCCFHHKFTEGSQQVDAVPPVLSSGNIRYIQCGL